jgi:NADH-quinone oxidoreductase subunit N
MLPSLFELWSFASETILLIFAIVGLLYAAFAKGEDGGAKAEFNLMLALVGLGASFVCLFAFDGQDHIVFNGHYALDWYTILAKGFILLSGFLALLLFSNNLDRYGLEKAEVPVLVLFCVCGMMIMVSASDLLSLFLGLEMQSLCIYVIAAMSRDDGLAQEAAMKYFILGALSSAIILYGFSLIYGFTGATNFEALSDTLRDVTPNLSNLGLQFGVIIMLAGLAFKISAVPFHMWAPDVYDGVPTPVTAFFASVPKLAAVFMVYRLLLEPFSAMAPIFEKPLIFMALASAFWGAIAGVMQTHIKRLFAYSSISHIGFLLLGALAQNESGLQAAFYYMTAYVLMTLAFFGCILMLKREGKEIKTIHNLKGLGRSHPLLAAIIAGLMFSFAGIPPFAGFFAKLYIVFAVVEMGYVWVPVMVILSSVISAFYYIRIIKVMYFDAPSALELDGGYFQTTKFLSSKIVLALAIGGLVILSAAPDLLLKCTRHASISIFSH